MKITSDRLSCKTERDKVRFEKYKLTLFELSYATLLCDEALGVDKF